MRLHLPSLPHTETTRDFCWCAYTEKVRKLGKMLTDHGHEVILYGGERNEAEVTEHVVVVTGADLERWFGGPWDHADVFDLWDPAAPCWVEMNRAVSVEMSHRVQPGDALGIIGGRCQEALKRAFPELLAIEWGVGYEGVIEGTHRAYESVAWRHYVQGWYHDSDGHSFDTVIPNSFEPDELMTEPEPDDYLLYLGRPTWKKGLEVVTQVAKRRRVVTAGQADPGIEGATYAGLMRGEEKAELLARASAVLVPTQYIEPFGGVAVEAMMSGVPVITSDWGAFTETVINGLDGYRCSTLADYLDATERVHELDREAIATRARARYSCETIGGAYDRWLRKLALLDGAGWYELNPGT